MRGWTLDGAAHAEVTEAVAAAETRTDGEIVTIVSATSDAYHDVGLHYAVIATLLVPVLAAFAPERPVGWMEWLHGGWIGEDDTRWLLLAVLIVQTLVFLLVRYLLAWMPLRLALTPRATKARRVRRRAVQFFKAAAEQRTAARVGVLLYVSMAEHLAEIVADEAIHARVPPETWGEAMVALVDRLRDGDTGGGMAAAVARIGAVLAEHFPKTGRDTNELPDRLIEL